MFEWLLGKWEEHTKYKEHKYTRMRIPGVLKMKKGLRPMSRRSKEYQDMS